MVRPPAGVSGPGKEYTLPSCLLYRACWIPKNFSRRVLLGDGLFVASMNKTTFALSHPRRNRRQARGGRCKLPQEGHRRPFHSRRAPRLLGCSSPIFWLTRTAIGETAWSSNGGGHQAYRVSQATFSSRNFSPVGRAGPGREGHCTTMRFSTFGSDPYIDVATRRRDSAERGGVPPNCCLPPLLCCFH